MQQTVTQNADGSTTLTNSAYNIDGTLAETVAATTSAANIVRFVPKLRTGVHAIRPRAA